MARRAMVKGSGKSGGARGYSRRTAAGTYSPKRESEKARGAGSKAASGLVEKAHRYTSVGVSVAELRQLMGVSQEELGRATGYSTRSVAGWEGGQPMSDSARQKLQETARLRGALAEVMPADSVGQWLRTPNPAFEGQTPIQVIERGESDRIWRMIFQIDANVAS